MKNIYILLISLILSVVVNAHNEDTPGPHGGQIQMPGNIHTEVTHHSKNSFRVYLLDINIKNPITKNSSVQAYIEVGKKQIKLKCRDNKTDYFVCEASKKINLNKGILVVKAIRDGNIAPIDAKYPLPLNTFN